MHKKEHVTRFAELQRLCREREIPVTPQRRAVFEALLQASDHPTAERLHDTVTKTLSGISLATVYRVLELFVDLGVARRTCSPGSRCRYDANLHRHHHLVCFVCERMVDLEDASLNRLPVPNRRRTGFRVEDYSIHFRGTCADCLRKEDHHS